MTRIGLEQVKGFDKPQVFLYLGSFKKWRISGRELYQLSKDIPTAQAALVFYELEKLAKRRKKPAMKVAKKK